MSGAQSAGLPASLTVSREGQVAHLRLTRAHKRNALDDDTRSEERRVGKGV